MHNPIDTIWLDLNEELYKFIVSKIKDELTAQDIHQEVFLKVRANIHQLKHTSRLTSWVYQVTRNTIIDYFRKTEHSYVSLDQVEIPEAATDNFDYTHLTNCINNKIAQLAAQHQEAIILTSFKNYSQKDLAKHLQISYSGAKSRVQKAREILKSDILDCPNVATNESGKPIDFEK